MGAISRMRVCRLVRPWWWAGVVVLLALLAFAPAALAVPGGPDPDNEVDQAGWLAGLQGSPLPVPSAGAVGILNTSGVNSASANQVNDPSLDSVQAFAGTVPFVTATEAETSVAVAGQNVVVGYNSMPG
jgi:hypothetical protein